MVRGALYQSYESDSLAMGEYHGWQTPLRYGNLDEEFAAATSGAGVVDLSMFGRVEVAGGDRLDLLHRLTTNSLNNVRRGEAAPTIFVTDKGRIIDRVLVIVNETSLLLITSPGMESRLMEWIAKYTITEEITSRCVTPETAMICIVGPRATSFTSAVIGQPCVPHSASTHLLAGVRTTVALEVNSRAQRACIVVENMGAVPVFHHLSDRAREFGARMIGSMAYESYRISRGIAARDSELREMFTPYDVGLREDISFTKGCYIGQEVIARIDTYQKVKRGLAGLLFPSGNRTASGTPLLKGEVEIGVVTSVTPAPVGGRMFGLGVVVTAEAPAGEKVTCGGSSSQCTIVDLPIQV